jgi:PIN domain nuclease of toxin-antitoxin system
MSQIIVLDSHVWFWWINLEHDRLSPRMLATMESARRVGVSAVSCYELALAHHRGRLELSLPPSAWFPLALAGSNVELLPLTPEIAIRATELSPVHRDPFDRIIIATTLQMDGMLASVDGHFISYSELEGRLIDRKGHAPNGNPS